MPDPRILVLAGILKRSDWDEYGCLIWNGPKSKGYGQLNVGGRRYAAHRASLSLYIPQPADKPFCCHKCNVPACVNPAHLYWGDAKDNMRDCLAAGRASGGRAGATHCVNGHEFTDENTYWEPRGWGRACKECRRTRVREFRARQRELTSA